MSQTRLNVAQLKTLGAGNIASDAELTDAITEHENALDPHSQYLTDAEVTAKTGVPGGLAPLNADGLLPSASIPTQTIVNIVQSMNVDGGQF